MKALLDPSTEAELRWRIWSPPCQLTALPESRHISFCLQPFTLYSQQSGFRGGPHTQAWGQHQLDLLGVRPCNLHFMSTQSINTIDFQTGLFGSCISWIAGALSRKWLVMNNNAELCGDSQRFFPIWLKQWLLLCTGTEDEYYWRLGHEAECLKNTNWERKRLQGLEGRNNKFYFYSGIDFQFKPIAL